jgi:hypothetical protein
MIHLHLLGTLPIPGVPQKTTQRKPLPLNQTILQLHPASSNTVHFMNLLREIPMKFHSNLVISLW